MWLIAGILAELKYMFIFILFPFIKDNTTIGISGDLMWYFI